MGYPAGMKQVGNLLAGEVSPYLLQHAHNPVAWMPWGPAVWDKARAENRPVFLSIGYSTCHWCHVMERESFEDEKIAEILNREFIPVKVDREERPDVDRVYMTAVQAMTGQGGWPLSVWLTPEGKPFYGGTYFPPHGVHGRPGFPDVLRQIAQAWKERKGEVESWAEELSSRIRAVGESSGGHGEIRDAEKVLRRAMDELAAEHLSIDTVDPEATLTKIRHVGAAFLGPHSPVAAGDYAAGPSHVLPTGGTARFAEGLSANSFLRGGSVIRLAPRDLADIAADIATIASVEGLTAHRRSVEARPG